LSSWLLAMALETKRSTTVIGYVLVRIENREMTRKTDDESSRSERNQLL